MTMNGEKIIEIGTIATAIALPEYSANNLVSRIMNRKEAPETYFYYMKKENKYYASLSGALYMFQKFGGVEDCVSIIPVLKEFLEDNNTLLTDLKALVEKYNNQTETDEAATEEIPAKKKHGRGTYENYERDRKFLPTADEETKKWTGQMTKLLRENTDVLQYPTVSLNMKAVYTKMRDVYGIVFEQERKEFVEKYHLDECLKISIMRLIQEKQELQSLFESILENNIEEGKKKYGYN